MRGRDQRFFDIKIKTKIKLSRIIHWASPRRIPSYTANIVHYSNNTSDTILKPFDNLTGEVARSYLR